MSSEPVHELCRSDNPSCSSVCPPALPPPPASLQIAYWLLQNGIKVMIAACDTFRSGAVEQLKTHCARLQVRGALAARTLLCCLC